MKLRISQALLSGVLLSGTILSVVPTASAAALPPHTAAYLRWSGPLPWGSDANETGMDWIFGAGQWQSLRFETVNLSAVLPGLQFLFVDGSDGGPVAMESFLTTQGAQLEAWVSAGNVVFLNAAPGTDNGMNLRFGVTLNYPDVSGDAHLLDAAHPIFRGPYLPVGASWTGGSFSHATVSGAGLTPLLRSGAGQVMLAEKPYGAGWALFGGMTPDAFHSPQPQVRNLFGNILTYASTRVGGPTNVPPAIVTQPPSLAVLVGETVTLCVTASGSRPLSFQWLFNGAALPGQSNSCLVLPSVTTNSSGGYKVIVSNPLGTVTSDRAQLTVSVQGPHITSQPASLSLQAGDTALFAVSASGGPLFYQWRHDDVDLAGATNAVLRIDNVTRTNEGTYQVVVSNLLGYVTSRPATLAVQEFAPSFLVSPQDVDSLVGDEVSFSVSVQAAPPARLQWRRNAADLPGETNEFLVLHAVTTNQAGIYTVWATNSVGGALSSPARLTVGGRPPEILEEPADVSVRPGEVAFFEVIADGLPSPQYQWRFNGVDLPGANSSDLTFGSVAVEQAGNYTVVVSNPLGSVTSRVARLEVRLQAPVIGVQPPSLTVNAGDNVFLSVVASGIPTPTYQWMFGNSALPGATNSILVLNNIFTNQAGVYTVVVSNIAGVVVSQPATVTVRSAPPVFTVQPISRTVPYGTNVQFTVAASGTPPPRFQWRLNGVPLPARTNTTLLLAGVTPAQAGEYSATASNSVGFATSQSAFLVVTQQAPVILVQPVDRTVFGGETATFTVTASAVPAPTYRWLRNGITIPGSAPTLTLINVSQNDAGAYSVVVSNLAGTVTSAPAVLTVQYLPPVITIPPISQTVAAGGSAVLSVTATGTPPLSYRWRFNEGPIARGTNSFLTLTSVGVADDGNYSVVVTNFGGSVTSPPARVTVDFQPPSFTLNPTNQSVREYSNATFRAFAVGSPTPRLQWYFNGNITGGGTNSTATNSIFTVFRVTTNDAGIYTAVAANSVGSITSAPAVLTIILTAPIINQQPISRTVLVGQPVAFSLVVTGSLPLLYQWQKDGTDLPGRTNVVLSLSATTTNDAGAYAVVVRNPAGTITSASATLTVRERVGGQSQFRVTGLFTTHSRVVDHEPVTGDDHGGIAASTTRLFYSGDLQTARFDLSDLGGATGLGSLVDGLIGDLGSGRIYTVGNDAGISGSALLTNLVELDGATGSPNGTRIPLSQPILLTFGSGMFAGYNEIVIYNGSHVYSVDLPSGLVTDEGPFLMPTHTGCETWAFWGVAELIDNQRSLVYVQDFQTIARVRLNDRHVETVASFENLSDMCSFTLSLALNRWYFHHEGPSQFGGSVETAGYADATWLLDGPGPARLLSEPQDLTVVATQPALLSVAATGTRPLYYQWVFQGTNLPGATNASLSFPRILLADAGGYSVVVTNVLSSVTSRVATVTVIQQAPVILAQPGNQNVFAGATASFFVQASGQPPPEYQWQFNNTNLPGATNASLVLSAVTTNLSGSYQVVVSNLAGVVVSQPATLIVRLQPPSIVVQPVSRNVLEGANVSFSVIVTGAPPFQFQWRFNSTDLPSATNATLSLTAVTTNQTGSYQVVVSNPAGSVTSQVAALLVRVRSVGDFRITSLLPTHSRVVDHDAITGDDRGGIAASTARVFYTGDNQTARFLLTDLSGGAGVGRVIDGLVGELNTATAYTLANGTNTPTGPGLVTSLIQLDPNTGALTANRIDLSQPINMSSGSGLFAGFNEIVLFNGSRIYRVDILSGQVTDEGPFFMPNHSSCENWAFWGIAEVIDGQLHLAYVQDSQTIARVRVFDGQVSPIASFSSLSDMCSFTLSLTLNRWYFHHEGSSQFGGTSETIGYADATWDVVAPGPPLFNSQPADLTVLAGQPASFAASVRGLRPLSYQWRFGATPIAGATNAILDLPAVSTNDAGGYSVVVTNALGSITSRVAQLTVNVTPPQILAQPVSRAVALGRSASFAVAASGAPPPTYQWQFNGSNLPGATNSTLNIPSVTTNHVGIYRVVVSNPFGTVTSSDAVLSIRPQANLAVLLIWDSLFPGTNSVGTGTAALRAALQDAGYVVDLSPTSESFYDGSNPPVDGYDVVVHLNGTTYNTDMPLSGQDALRDFVRQGGGYIGAEWNAYEITQAGHMVDMRDLILFDRSGDGQDGTNTWVVVPAQAGHQVLANVPAAFPVNSPFNFGGLHEFLTQPATVLMTDLAGHPAVAVREFESGRVVAFKHAANYESGGLPFNTLLDINVQQLYIDGVSWAGRLDSVALPPSITRQPASQRVTETRDAVMSVAARGAHPLSYQWRFQGTSLPGATSAVLLLPHVSQGQAGIYDVVVTNVLGAITSAPAVLTVQQTITVGVFDNPTYVDSDGSSSSESDTVQATLNSLGHDVATFVNIATGLEANQVVLFPEFERGDLGSSLTDAERAAIASFVNEGGGLILHGVPDPSGRTTTFLNRIFGWSLEALQLQIGRGFSLTALADGTAFGGGPLSLSAQNGSSGFNSGSLPPDALPIYEDGAQTLVAILPYGRGKVVFLGWDWFDARPLGSQDGGWLNTLDAAVLEASSGVIATNNPPTILSEPADRSTLAGRTAIFRVRARGSLPLDYQWQFEGTVLPGATNSILTLTNVQFSQRGGYRVVVTNPFGSVTSRTAQLTVLEAAVGIEFRIVRLTDENGAVVDHEGLTGDDRGGIAVSDTSVFYTGDASTARFDRETLSNGQQVGQRYDGLVSNLRTEQVYSLADGANPLSQGGGPISSLIEIDGATGALTANRIDLSETINASSDTGIFAGYDQVVLLTGGHVIQILLPSGVVVDLGEMSQLSHQGCENWAYWGVAENFEGAIHLVYVQNSQTIVRARVPDGATEVVSQFSQLSDMCSFTLSLPLNRWFFHYEGSGQFGGTAETLGSADVVWEFPVPPVPPSIVEPPQPVNALAGGTASFHVVATGSQLNYFWRFNGALIPFSNSNTLVLVNLQTNQSGLYSVEVRNAFGVATSAPVALTVSTIPASILVPPANRIGVLGGDVLFTVEAAGAPPPAYQWFFNSAPMAGATSPSLHVSQLTLAQSGIYRVSVSNFAGSALSPPATLTVVPQVPLPEALDATDLVWTTGGGSPWSGQPFISHDGYDAAQSGFVLDDEEGWLETTVPGPGTVSFQWKVSSEPDFDVLVVTLNGVDQASISGEQAWTLHTINLPAGTNVLRWSYRKDGSFEEGADRAWIDEVVVQTPPRILTQPSSRASFRGSNVTFRVVAVGTPPPSYQWQFNGTNLPGATSPTLTLLNITTNQAGPYRALVSNSYGSVTSVTATLTITRIGSVLTLAANPTEWNADVRQKLQSSGFFDRVDARSAAMLPVPTLAELQAYDAVLVYSDNGFADAELLGNTLVDYSDQGGGLVFATFAFGNGYFQGRILTAGILPIVPDSQESPVSLTMVKVLPDHPLLDGVATFIGGSATYHNTGPVATNATLVARWSDGHPLVATIDRGSSRVVGLNFYPPSSDARSDFWVASTDGARLMANSLAYVGGGGAEGPPAIVEQPGSQTVLAGAALTFSVHAIGKGPITYQWLLNGAAIPGATNSDLTLDPVLPVNAGEYSVVVGNSFGASSGDPWTLTVTAQPPVLLSQPASQSVLGGGTVVLAVTASGAPAPTFQWKLDGVDIPGATGPTLTISNTTVANAGIYKVVARNLAGAVTSLPARLTVNVIAPSIVRQPVGQAVLAGTNATFSVIATGAPPPTYQWQRNGADLPGETRDVLTVLQPTSAHAGTYRVVVRNSGGTVLSASALLSVMDPIPLGEALDANDLIWTTGGGAPWFGQPMITHDGTDAARSGGVGNALESWLETTVLGPGTLTFFWKVSSELGFDSLQLSVGGAPQGGVSGEVDWQTRSVPLGSGRQTVRWTYRKDGSAAGGLDAGWVDQVSIVTTPMLAIQILLTGPDCQLLFPTSPGRQYRVERCASLRAPVWEPVPGAEALNGNGLFLQVTDHGVTSTQQRFYRVVQSP